MNIVPAELLRQYETAKRLGWAPLAHEEERRRGFPPYAQFAVFSRETNMGRLWSGGRYIDDYYIHNPGDGGHGRGLGQVDDRSHFIPANWAGNVGWQITESANVLADCFRRSNDEISAYNRYNSGQPTTARTTGKDYGPDVMARRLALLDALGLHSQRKDDDVPQLDVPPGENRILQYRAWPGVLALASENIGTYDATKKEWKLAEGANVRVAFGDDEQGWLTIEEVWVAPHRRKYQLPGDKEGVVNVGNKGPNHVSVSIEYDDA